MNKQDLLEELTDAFIVYQYRLENPMPLPSDTKEKMIMKYRGDPIFHHKVVNVVSGVMLIVDKYLETEDEIA